jgi:hypothetical protein
MPRKLDHVFHDMLETIARVEEITRGKSLQDFEASWQLRRMVQRAIEIISESKPFNSRPGRQHPIRNSLEESPRHRKRIATRI